MHKTDHAPIMLMLLASLLTFGAPRQTEAADAPSQVPPVHFSGFGTIGFTHNHGDGSSFVRDLSQPGGANNRGLAWEIDSRAGIQANFKPADNLEAVAQIVSRYRTDNTFNPELTWGFLKYSPADPVDLRIGRVGYDVFIGADSRDVGYSYLWVRPPVEFYGQLFNSYIDGGDIAVRHPIENGIARAKIYSGLVRQLFAVNHTQTSATGSNGLYANGPLADLHGSRITGMVLEYQDTHWIVKLGRTDVRLRVNFLMDHVQPSLPSLFSGAATMVPPTMASTLNSIEEGVEPNGKHVIFTSIGIAYENGPLQVQTGANHFVSGFEAFPPSNSGFISAGYRIGKFTPYATISGIKGKQNRRPAELASLGAPPLLVELTRFSLGSGQRDQHTFSLGMRYDIAEHAALKLQLDRTFNRTCSPLNYPLANPAPACAPPMLWPAVPQDWNGRATIFSTVLDFTF